MLLPDAVRLIKNCVPIQDVVGEFAPLKRSGAHLKGICPLFACIDDVERRRPDLHLRDVLGFVSELTETHDCRCVCVFDKTKLEGDDLKSITKFEEKVFDLSITFDPKPCEVLGIVFTDPSHVVSVEPVLLAFDFTNIRILRRMAWATGLVGVQTTRAMTYALECR